MNDILFLDDFNRADVLLTADGEKTGAGSATDEEPLCQDGMGGVYFSNAVLFSPFDNLKLTTK